jgi:hypothetical protein
MYTQNLFEKNLTIVENFNNSQIFFNLNMSDFNELLYGYCINSQLNPIQIFTVL